MVCSITGVMPSALTRAIAGSSPASPTKYFYCLEISEKQVRRRYEAMLQKKKHIGETSMGFYTNATATICGETYDVRLVSGPNIEGLCVVDVPFGNGEFVERLAVVKANIHPTDEEAVELLTNVA